MRSFPLGISLIALVWFFLSACANSTPEAVAIGKNPIRVAIAPDGSQLYVANHDDGTVSVIPIRNDRLGHSATVAFEGRPNSLLVAQDGSRLYVGLDKGANAGAVAVLEVKTLKHTSLPTGGPIRYMVWSRDGTNIYLAMEFGGLGKLRLSDGTVALLDRTPCPEGLAITSAGRLFVSYQCAPNGTASGHDPIAVFDTTTDSFEHWIVSDIAGEPFPNVGGLMSLSPDEKVIWENGNDACSRKYSEDPGGYDFIGCDNTIKEFRGRGVINVIDTKTSAVILTKGFVGKPPGSDYYLGASVPTFFPASCHFAPDFVAVSTEQGVLTFSAESLDRISSPEEVPRIPRAGSIVFSPGCRMAYIVSFQDNAVHARTINRDGTFGLPRSDSSIQTGWKAYREEWKEESALFAAAHSIGAALLLYVIAFLSPAFASVVGRWPILSRPLELDVLIRKARSVLLRLYIGQLRSTVSRSLRETRAATIVPLPILRVSSTGTASRQTNTEQWIQDFTTVAADSATYLRVAVSGEGGQGKSVFVQRLISRLVDRGFCPILLQGPTYALEPSLAAWIQRVLDNSNVPLKVSVLRSVPSLVAVIDGVSEVPVANQEQFWELIRAEFTEAAAVRKLVVAGRSFDSPDSEKGSLLRWNEVVKFEDLTDEVIKKLGVAYLDPGGPSTEIDQLPAAVRRISTHPTAFIVSRFVAAARMSSRPVDTEGDLYREILDSYVTERKLGVQPRLAKQILERLVMKEFGVKGTRGLPSAETELWQEVEEVFTEGRFVDLFGVNSIPAPVDFVDALKRSGLLERVGDRYAFFHDSFEDWLLGEAESAGTDGPTVVVS